MILTSYNIWDFLNLLNWLCTLYISLHSIAVLSGPEPSPAVAKAGSSRKPLLFISPQLNLAASVAVDTSLPLEAQVSRDWLLTRCAEL